MPPATPPPRTPGGVAGLGVSGSKPPSRAGTASANRPATSTTPTAAGRPATNAGTPRTARSSGPTAELSVLAQKLILKLRAKFGDSAADVKGQEIISQEVLGFVQRGVMVKEEDIVQLEYRIRQRLTGGTPVTNTLAADKKLQMQGDEWARIFQYSIAEGNEKDRKEAIARKELQLRTRQELKAQMAERDAAKQAEKDEEMAYARQEQAALQAWEASEAARKQLQLEIANRLKQERAEQLVDKETRRQNAWSRKQADEEELAARIAFETKTEFEKEEAQRQEAKFALRAFLAQNEENKALKEATKLAAWAEDAHFQQAWRDVLDKQDRERRSRLEQILTRQAKTAEYANSGALPEYKRWVDPALIERHYKEREERADRQEKAALAAAHAKDLAVAAELKLQMNERDSRRDAERREAEAKGRIMVERAQAEELKEQARRRARDAGKLAFRAELERQMKDNVTRRRHQPMSDVEHAINKELLSKVQTWKQTGRVDLSGTNSLPL